MPPKANMKKPAGAAEPDVEGSLDATEDSVPVTQGSNAPAPPTAEQQAQLDFLAANHNARKAAYGRMATAVQQYKGPDADAIIKLYNETQAKGGAGRFAKSRQLVEDWIIDPSFGRSAARYRIAIETSEELKSDDEIVSKSRLEVLEGSAGAKELIEMGALPETTDRYGRPAYIWSRTRSSRKAKKKRSFEQNTEMTLNSKQAEAINTRLGDSHLSLDPRPAKLPRKAQKELTEEEQKNKEIKTNLRKALQKCDKAQLAADKAIGSLKKSKHPIASKLWPSIKEKKDKLTASIKVVEDDMLTQPKEDKANSDIEKAQKALDILNKDIGLANSI